MKDHSNTDANMSENNEASHADKHQVCKRGDKSCQAGNSGEPGMVCDGEGCHSENAQPTSHKKRHLKAIAIAIVAVLVAGGAIFYLQSGSNLQGNLRSNPLEMKLTDDLEMKLLDDNTDRQIIELDQDQRELEQGQLELEDSRIQLEDNGDSTGAKILESDGLRGAANELDAKILENGATWNEESLRSTTNELDAKILEDGATWQDASLELESGLETGTGTWNDQDEVGATAIEKNALETGTLEAGNQQVIWQDATTTTTTKGSLENDSFENIEMPLERTGNNPEEGTASTMPAKDFNNLGDSPATNPPPSYNDASIIPEGLGDACLWFEDVDPTHPYYKAVNHGVHVGKYLDGPTNECLFRVNDTLTRAEIAKLLVLAFELPAAINPNSAFPDVQQGTWFYEYVMRVAAFGIMDGYANGTFKPAQEITRAEMAKVMYASYIFSTSQPNTITSPSLEVAKKVCPDLEGNVVPWYVKYFEQIKNKGFMKFNEACRPSDLVTRGEAAELIYNVTW